MTNTPPAPALSDRQREIAGTWAAVHEAVAEYAALAPTPDWRQAWETLGRALRRLEQWERERYA